MVQSIKDFQLNQSVTKAHKMYKKARTVWQFISEGNNASSDISNDNI